MTEIELKRKELDRLIIRKDFNLSDSEVIARAIEFEKNAKNHRSYDL